MQAGKLDQRVTLEQLVTIGDSWGGTVEAWAPLMTVWAEVSPLVGREYLAAQAAQSEVTARVTMRYRRGITAQDRVIHDGTIYGIESLVDVRSGHRELVLMCKAVG